MTLYHQILLSVESLDGRAIWTRHRHSLLVRLTDQRPSTVDNGASSLIHPSIEVRTKFIGSLHAVTRAAHPCERRRIEDNISLFCVVCTMNDPSQWSRKETTFLMSINPSKDKKIRRSHQHAKTTTNYTK